MPRPGSFTPGKARYPLHRRLGGPHGQSGRVPKISPPPPGFDARTVQSVTSRYTDWAMPASTLNSTRCCEGVTRVRTKYGNTGLSLPEEGDRSCPWNAGFSVLFWLTKSRHWITPSSYCQPTWRSPQNTLKKGPRLSYTEESSSRENAKQPGRTDIDSRQLKIRLIT